MLLMSTRRGFLRRALELSGVAAGAEALLSSVQRASAIEAPSGSSYLDAEHIVILMQENRSFDHCFGTLRGVRGFNDPRSVTLPNRNPVWLQTNAAGESYVPFRFNIRESRITWLGSLPHNWDNQQDARNGGNHDGWLDAKRSDNPECAGMPLTMGYYEREDIPFYYALADAFTVCDQHFCASLTATTPNRLHLWTGTIRDAPRSDCPPRLRNEDTDYGATARWTTFPERLEQAGISWKIYQNEVSYETGLEDEHDSWLANFGDNPLEWFEQYRVGFAEGHRRYLRTLPAVLPSEIEGLKKKIALAPHDTPEHERLVTLLRQREALLGKLPDLLNTYTKEEFDKLPVREQQLHSRAFTANSADPDYHRLEALSYRDGEAHRELQVPAGDVLYQFREDVTSGRLPAVSWIVAPENFSDHPSAPWFGAWYVSEVLNILTRDPEVWRKTIFILTYDENDGYFDHVPPFTAPQPGNPDTGATSAGIDATLEYVPLEQDLQKHSAHEARGGSIGLGFRVPLIVASPWSRGGYVCSQVFDHTSVLQLLEMVISHKVGKPIRETNISQWRRAVCGDLSSVFEPAHGPGTPDLPFSSRDAVIERIHKAKFRQLPGGFHRFMAAEIEEFRNNPHGSSWMPHQEEGVRPSRALPYQLYAEGLLSADGKSLHVAFEAGREVFGAKSAAGPFHVYTPVAYRRQRTRAYTVAAGERLVGSWTIDDFDRGIYHLRICGPNGFYREFTGDAHDPKVEIRCEYERGASGHAVLTGNIDLHLITYDEECRFLIYDHAYGSPRREGVIRPGTAVNVVLNLQRSFRWYDFTVRIAGADVFERRYAGRVETSESGFSDPAMAGSFAREISPA